MYNLLVVDDEDIAVRGIVQGINWSDVPIGQLFTACDAEEAKEVLLQEKVHIVLSDIDMPDLNGIQLLEWVNEHSPSSVTVFLTGHADFKYAQQAVQLDCFDYLLKPVDHEVLKTCIHNAIEKVVELEELEEIRSTYSHYYEQWNKQRPALIERFWQDMLHYRVSAAPVHLDSSMETYGIPLRADSEIRAVLISIEHWREEWSARDEEIMTYGVKNAAAELVLGGKPGHIVHDGNGILYALFYSNEEDERAIAARCNHFIQQARGLLHCQLSCYIGAVTVAQQLRGSVQRLLDLERSNVNAACAVIHESSQSGQAASAAIASQPLPFTDWAMLLAPGKRAELLLRIDEHFDHLQQSNGDYTQLASFYFGFMNMVFQWLSKQGVAITDVFAKREWEAGEQVMKSLPRMRSWTHQVCMQLTDYAGTAGKDVSQVVAKVQRYMEEHLDEQFSREHAAEAVYLNPAYLSRLFRRETGHSLTDYLVRMRIARAREELEKTNTKISDIAVMIGYSNFSHFSKLFKKETGLTPQEYRKKVQHI
ncbi:helix-turn-helix domain-containing protein [Paenibacillus algorifonticola]|uniref:response regulator n=1 Tax=Paenibacillus algorifonticola TaxID=684063 RepID=UPI003D28CE55